MIDRESIKSKWKLAAAVTWLLFTLTMAAWWCYLGLSFLRQIESHQIVMPEIVLRQKNMLIWEGMAWMVLLFGGGITLIYLVAKERVQSKRLRQFLATFSHDVKTALTSLRLQTDILREEDGDSPVVRRLESDVVRLQLQLENSLFLASEEDIQLFIESMSLNHLVDSWREHWPNLNIEIHQEATIRGDRRAIECIFGNILQNSQVHGRAKNMRIKITALTSTLLEVELADDGRGFKGEIGRLGRLFERHNPSSGSGVGLYSVVNLVQRMGGEVQFISDSEGGFRVLLKLPGELS